MIIKFNTNFKVQMLNDLTNKFQAPYYIGNGYLKIDNIDLEQVDKTFNRLQLKYTTK